MFSAPGWNRTSGLELRKLALYPLSYRRVGAAVLMRSAASSPPGRRTLTRPAWLPHPARPSRRRTGRVRRARGRRLQRERSRKDALPVVDAGVIPFTCAP